MYTLPNAKINIGLRVTQRRSDGYHNLQTVFYPIPLTDALEIEPLKASLDKPYEFLTSGIAIPGNPDDNLVVKVFLSLQREFDLPPVSIHLAKHIPMGAGLGGGSSDAASMMRMLNEHFDLGLTDREMEQRLASFGADCPFFVRNKPVYAQGIGNEFSSIRLSLKGHFILLVKPSTHVSTAEAYGGVVPQMPQTDLGEMIENTPIRLWRSCIVNDFEKTVFQHHPQLAAIKQTLYDMGAVYAAMSGSGSAMYGIFSRPIENAVKIFPDCFIFANRLS